MLGLSTMNVFAQLSYSKSNHFLCIKLNDKAIVRFNTQEPILKQYEIVLNQKMKFGSYHFNEKIKEEQAFYFHKIDQNSAEVQIHLKNKHNETIILYGVYENERLRLCTGNKISVSQKQEIFIESEEKELFYGTGIQCSFFVLNGNKIPIYSEENGIGRGDEPITTITNIAAKAGGNKTTSYVNMPFVISNALRVIESETLAKCMFDFRKARRFSITFYQENINLSVRKEDNIKAIYKSSIPMKPLPDWAFKPWLGLQGGKKRVNEIVQRLEKNEIKIGAIWIQDWVGRRKTRFGSQLWWHWEADSLSYPQLKRYADSLWNNNQYALLGYVNSFVAPESSIAQNKENNRFFILKNNTPQVFKTPGFPTLQVNLNQPYARDWFASIINTKLKQQGFRGWMADYAEWYKNDTLSNHHAYMLNWVKCNAQAIHNDTSIVYFNRSGCAGITPFTSSIWLGDQMTTFGNNDGLPSVMRGFLSGGISGLQNVHADIGGYTNVNTFFYKIKRNKDLLYRSLELNTFTPIMRTHEGLIPSSNEQVYDIENVAMYKKMTALHNQLIPYFKYLSQQAVQDKLPYIRPLFFHYLDDIHTHTIDDEFLLGEDLLVAPILKKNTFARNVYLPLGDWIFAYDGKYFEGGKSYNISSEYGKPIAFIKQGSKWENLFMYAFEKNNK